MKGLDLVHAITLAKFWTLPSVTLEIDTLETFLGEVTLLGPGGDFEETLVSGPQFLPVNLEGAPQGKWQDTLPCFPSFVFHLHLATCFSKPSYL